MYSVHSGLPLKNHLTYSREKIRSLWFGILVTERSRNAPTKRQPKCGMDKTRHPELRRRVTSYFPFFFPLRLHYIALSEQKKATIHLALRLRLVGEPVEPQRPENTKKSAILLTIFSFLTLNFICKRRAPKNRSSGHHCNAPSRIRIQQCLN